jgi:hypothetical protein
MSYDNVIARKSTMVDDPEQSETSNEPLENVLNRASKKNGGVSVATPCASTTFLGAVEVKSRLFSTNGLSSGKYFSRECREETKLKVISGGVHVFVPRVRDTCLTKGQSITIPSGAMYELRNVSPGTELVEISRYR